MYIYNSTQVRPYVYLCTHKTTKEFYIGYRELNVKLGIPSNEDLPRYKTSSKLVKPQFDQFDWIILAEFFDANSAYDFEQELIDHNWEDALLLNRNCRKYGKRFKGKVTHSVESKLKMSRQKSGKNNPMYGKIPYNYGIPQSKETIDKKIKSMIGNLKPDDVKEKIRNSLLGKPKEQVQCPICNKVGGKSPMLRWHFDNCKMKKES